MENYKLIIRNKNGQLTSISQMSMSYKHAKEAKRISEENWPEFVHEILSKDEVDLLLRDLQKT